MKNQNSKFVSRPPPKLPKCKLFVVNSYNWCPVYPENTRASISALLEIYTLDAVRLGKEKQSILVFTIVLKNSLSDCKEVRKPL